MKLSLFRRVISFMFPPIVYVPTASDAASVLGAMGNAARKTAAEREKAKRDAMTRELARCAGMTLPAPLQDKDA